jgi:hypothetical protein
MNLFSYNFRRPYPIATPVAARYRTGYAMPFATINGIRISTGQHTLERILRFQLRLDVSARAA